MRRKTSLINVFALILVAISVTQAISAEPVAQSYKEMFKTNSLAVYKHAVTIRMHHKAPVFKEMEVRFLQDSLDGKLDQFTCEEAALIVSGVTEPEKMAYYKIQLNEIAKNCEKDAVGCEGLGKANAILQSLFKCQMKAGYSSAQNDIAKLLDTGKFNCVSSAILFEIMAKRMNIEVTTVNIPRHVFCRVDNVDFETTSGKAFLASFRNKRYADQRKPNDLKEGAPYSKELSRETNYLGLLAHVYFNEGNSFTKMETPDYGKTVVKHLKAACLDKNSKMIGNQLRINIQNWFRTSMKNHEYVEAREIANMYKKMLRDPASADYMFQELQGVSQSVASR